MAKKKKIEENSELVTNRDQSLEPVAKCDHLEEVDANRDHLQSLKFRPTLPYAFTEQGMLK